MKLVLFLLLKLTRHRRRGAINMLSVFYFNVSDSVKKKKKKMRKRREKEGEKG